MANINTPDLWTIIVARYEHRINEEFYSRNVYPTHVSASRDIKF